MRRHASVHDPAWIPAVASPRRRRGVLADCSTTRPPRPSGRRAPSSGERAAGRAGTRARIQQVALELFTDDGYEATSLREIAEQLGVTKAALYYHFKTKDEIIESLVDDRVALIGELIDVGRTSSRARYETRREFLRRYSDAAARAGPPRADALLRAQPVVDAPSTRPAS